MTQEKSWNWVETIFRVIPVNVYYLYVFIFICSYIIYAVLTINIFGHLYWTLLEHIVVLSTCTLIVYELAGVLYFINKTRNNFRIDGEIPDNWKCIEDIYAQLEPRFIQSKTYYILTFLALAPFIIIDPIRGKYFLYYFIKPTLSSAVLDVYNLIITIVIISSMMAILWIIFNISLILIKTEAPYLSSYKSDPCNAKMALNITSTEKLVLELTVFQFVGITLGVISFITPNEILYYEISFLLAIFLINIIFFFNSWRILKDILVKKRDYKLDLINKLFYQKKQRYYKTISDEVFDTNDKQLNDILISCNLLRDEKKRLMQTDRFVYDIKNALIFIGSSLMPIITLFVMLNGHKIMLKLFNP